MQQQLGSMQQQQQQPTSPQQQLANMLLQQEQKSPQQQRGSMQMQQQNSPQQQQRSMQMQQVNSPQQQNGSMLQQHNSPQQQQRSMQLQQHNSPQQQNGSIQQHQSPKQQHGSLQQQLQLQQQQLQLQQLQQQMGKGYSSPMAMHQPHPMASSQQQGDLSMPSADNLKVAQIQSLQDSLELQLRMQLESINGPLSMEQFQRMRNLLDRGMSTAVSTPSPILATLDMPLNMGGMALPGMLPMQDLGGLGQLFMPLGRDDDAPDMGKRLSDDAEPNGLGFLH
jgi:hypothetical protein